MEVAALLFCNDLNNIFFLMEIAATILIIKVINTDNFKECIVYTASTY